MEAKEDGDTSEECSSSPIQVLRQISEDAARMDGEALQNVYSSNSQASGPGHRRCQSEVLTAEHSRNNSFGRWKAQVQKALQWGSHSQNRSRCSSFNPEVLTNQKRQWYQFNSKTSNQKKYEEPTSLFEHFIIAGLHPDANLEAVEAAFAKRKARELDMEKYDMIDLKLLQNQEASSSTLEPQILFNYPPGKRLAVRPKDLAAFCFPGGVKARVLEKSPSLSDLNELVYGQEHLSRDDLSFIFSLKVAGNATLYGVCLHVQEIVQRAPTIFGAASPIPQSSRGFSRFLVAAPRCYCVLTRVPFFELHYEMLNSIIAQDRLNRITQVVSEMSLIDYVPSGEKVLNPMNGNIDSPYDISSTDWMGSAIPIGNVLAHTAAAAGIILDDEVPSSSSRWESLSPESGSGSETPDHFQTREVGKDGRKNLHYFDDSASEASENRSDGLDRTNGSYDNGQTPMELGPYTRRRSRTLDHLESPESLFSPVRSIGSEDEDDEIILSREKEAGDEIIMEWARDNKNDMLQIVCGYHAMPIPAWGSEIVFQPLEHLQAIEYGRPQLSALGLSEKFLEQKFQLSPGAAEVNLKLAGAEEALALSIWTTATICRVLSLETVLLLIAGVLLEKQVAVLCPNLGVLSAVVLSFIPMIRPFEWQSLFLPVLPGKMLDFLEAPVPFIVGIQHKPADWKIKTSNFVQVNLVKNQVKTCHLPALPRRKELISKLRPIHTRLSSENPVATRHPVYRCNEVQAEAAAQFLAVMRHYLESLCSDLRSHTITSVQSNNDRVSLLLKDTFIDSFPSKDQPFVKTSGYQALRMSTDLLSPL
ncbi:uncharacterized protein LOC127814175 isoform X2 [Diospyros lotus]|uniref:uncharacterized protein LOC127814175 isoform X2 n=1 Tax=Diospyros lotus TaxID=55363 RepID=UPI0022596634|nr:uncharacterized protein LOC127814175 isoform X2 [Diospyros lotus]